MKLPPSTEKDETEENDKTKMKSLTKKMQTVEVGDIQSAAKKKRVGNEGRIRREAGSESVEGGSESVAGDSESEEDVFETDEDENEVDGIKKERGKNEEVLFNNNS